MFMKQICMKITKVYNRTQKVHLNMEQQGTEFLLLGSYITIHKYLMQCVYCLCLPSVLI